MNLKNQIENLIQIELKSNQEEIILKKLSNYIDELIKKDFASLIQLLYKIDINEKKIKENLANNTTQTESEIIAKMIIEREKEKINTRNLNKETENNDWIF